ncbi:cytochrome ubiquinol oxidase subunit I [Fibrobacterota bacterium]
MDFSPFFLSRFQFALTICFHFIFPTISIGLAWLLVVIEWQGYRKGDEHYIRLGRFLGKILALTFVMGVATGIVMEFQFGTNWSRYSEFVGDIFGAPLAAEGIFAFFLESSFMGLYIFGRNRVSKAVHVFSIFMVAVGATISAFWILVANSWQQTPAGYVVQNGRAELASFFEAVFNPSTLPRFFHTMDACLISGAFFVAGIAAYHLLINKETEIAKKALKLAVIFGFIASIAELFPFGDIHAKQVARTQPAKFAAMEGHFDTRNQAPMVVFGFPAGDPMELKFGIKVPLMLNLLAFGDLTTPVTGLNDFPENERPPVLVTFLSFHSMVALGGFFILVMSWAAFSLYRNTLYSNRKLLLLLVVSIPLPVIATELGWIAAEVGRQPWIVQDLLRTSVAYSPTVSSAEIIFSIVLFSLIYLLLGALYLFLLIKEIKHGPQPVKDGGARQ